MLHSVISIACGDDVLPHRQAVAIETSSPVDSNALSDAELEQAFRRMHAQVASPNEDAAQHAIELTELARALTRRTGDVSHVQTAIALLADAAGRLQGQRACDLELLRVNLLLVDLGQLVEGERAARELIARFADDDVRACVTKARSIAEKLASQPAVVAAVASSQVERTSERQAESSGVEDAESASWAQAHASADVATLERVTVYGGRAGSRVVRVVLYLDRPVAYQRGEARAEAGLPHRLFIDFDSIRRAPSVEATVPIGLGGLQRIRVLDLAARDRATHTRVSFDIDDGVLHRLFFLSEPYRVVIDFQAPEPESALTAKVRTIVLDPGHGGRNLGAHGPHGLREAVVALDLTRRVRALLRYELPGTRVILTRETNEDISLEERTAIANGENAQLFVSIHLNAWATSEQGGVATFVLDTSDDSQALRLAARENGTEVSDVSELQKVLAGLYRKEQVAQSLKLAEAIHQQTLASGRTVLPDLSDRGVKRAMFYVLVGATMPAVLVEPSFITNPEEAQALTTDAYRDKLAAGIAAGIARYARTL